MENKRILKAYEEANYYIFERGFKKESVYLTELEDVEASEIEFFLKNNNFEKDCENKSVSIYYNKSKKMAVACRDEAIEFFYAGRKIKDWGGRIRL